MASDELSRSRVSSGRPWMVSLLEYRGTRLCEKYCESEETAQDTSFSREVTVSNEALEGVDGVKFCPFGIYICRG
jgi:hypothetical protein